LGSRRRAMRGRDSPPPDATASRRDGLLASCWPVDIRAYPTSSAVMAHLLNWADPKSSPAPDTGHSRSSQIRPIQVVSPGGDPSQGGNPRHGRACPHVNIDTRRSKRGRLEESQCRKEVRYRPRRGSVGISSEPVERMSPRTKRGLS
jgi:hypothetical protein